MDSERIDSQLEEKARSAAEQIDSQLEKARNDELSADELESLGAALGKTERLKEAIEVMQKAQEARKKEHKQQLQVLQAASVPLTPLQPIQQNQPVIESPPRNGVQKAPVKILRPSVIDEITEKAMSKSVCIIRSPPATGKTSLLDLLEGTLKTRGGNSVKRLTMIEGAAETKNTEALLRWLRNQLGVAGALPGGYSELNPKENTWILIDDAQLVFGEVCRGFWQVVVKHLESSSSSVKVYVVISATYDLNSQGSTPILFRDYPHVEDVMFTRQEAQEIYDGYMNLAGFVFARDWTAVEDKILRLANGHVGVLTAGLAEISAVYGDDTQKRPTEDDALAALSNRRFRSRLDRCFPVQVLTPRQTDEITAVICTGPVPQTSAIDTSDSTNPRAQLVRAGILKSDGTFVCLLAQQHYFNHFYERPHRAPGNLVELMRLAISSMSAIRLRQSSTHRDFPKEAAFQQLLNEAMTKHLPPSVAVCPELNTFAEDPKTGDLVTGELDFLIDGGAEGPTWALEVLVNGKKIMEHHKRFDPKIGKYRKVGYNDYLVVDFRKTSKDGRPTNIQKMEKRCTVFFHDDYKRAKYLVGHQTDAEPLALRH